MTDPAVKTRPDSAHSGPEPAQIPAGQSGESGELPHWSTFARQHDWRRAQATASLTHADPLLQAALTALSALQQDVRARRYSAAWRAERAYAQNLGELQQTSPGDAALLGNLLPTAALEAALSALDAGNTNEADPAALQGTLAPALEHPLTRAEALNSLGVLLALRGEIPQAQQQFDDALQADAGHYRARMNIGNLALESGDAVGAETHFREVLKIAPEYDGAHHNLGVALRRQGKMQASVRSIRRAQRLGMRRTQQDAREEMQEQLRVNPRLRTARTVMFVVLALIVVGLLLLGRH